MAKSYQGAAALTMVRTATGGYVNVYKGDPVPDGVDSKDLNRLVEEKFLVEVKAEPAPEPTPAKEPNVDEILADVGNDKTKAAAAIETEKARGDKARTTLLSKLQAVVDA